MFLEKFRALAISGAVIAALYTPSNAIAQLQETCSPAYEEIIPLRNPRFDSVFLWRRIIGRTGYDWINTLTEIDENAFVTLGVASEDINDPNKVPSLALTRYDRGGHVVREKKMIIPGLKTVIASEKIEENLYVLVNTMKDNRSVPILIKTDFEAGKREVKEFHEENSELYASDMVLGQDGDLIVVFKGHNNRYAGDMSAIKYTVDKDLKTLRRRLYMPGTPNNFNRISLAEDGSLLAAGKMQVSPERFGGWVVNIDPKGAIYWQQSHARGAKSEFVKMLQLGEVGFAGVGTAWPHKEDDVNSALWVVKMDNSGTVIWQRFITGREEYSFKATDMFTHDDGRIVVLANAMTKNPTEKVRSHIRLITFSPQGTILEDQAFVEGANSSAERLYITAKGQYRIAGALNTGYMEEEAEAVGTPIQRGWLLAVSRPQDYTNPCGPKSK